MKQILTAHSFPQSFVSGDGQYTFPWGAATLFGTTTRKSTVGPVEVSFAPARSGFMHITGYRARITGLEGAREDRVGLRGGTLSLSTFDTSLVQNGSDNVISIVRFFEWQPIDWLVAPTKPSPYSQVPKYALGLYGNTDVSIDALIVNPAYDGQDINLVIDLEVSAPFELEA